MRAIIIVVAALVAIAWLLLGRPAKSTRQPGAGEPPANDPDGMGRALRQMMLTTPPQQMGVAPTPEFPHVYAVLVDWPLGGQVATVFASSTGAASLYTTSTFGIIGGEDHETVRTAAKALVRAAEAHAEDATQTTDVSYPLEGHVRFHFLTYGGVRSVDADLEAITNGSSEYAELFGLGQAVLTELRRVTEPRR